MAHKCEAVTYFYSVLSLEVAPPGHHYLPQFGNLKHHKGDRGALIVLPEAMLEILRQYQQSLAHSYMSNHPFDQVLSPLSGYILINNNLPLLPKLIPLVQFNNLLLDLLYMILLLLLNDLLQLLPRMLYLNLLFDELL